MFQKTKQWVQSLDNDAYVVYSRALQNGKLRMLQSFCIWIGLPLPIITALIVIGIAYSNFVGNQIFLVEGMAYLFSGLLNLIVKAHFKRGRPIDNKFASPLPFDEYSFPSGHSASTMAVAITLSFFVPRLAGGIIIWSFLIGLSRFFGGYHHPSDIVGGFAVGCISGCILLSLFVLLKLF